MAKSKNYDIVKNYYDDGLWSEYRVQMAVEKGWITEGEYKEITGNDYKATE